MKKYSNRKRNQSKHKQNDSLEREIMQGTWETLTKPNKNTLFNILTDKTKIEWYE